jgi:protocatechuate 3,4-dioxygenase beta subunit
VACTEPAQPTPAQTEGPYFKAGSPERTSLVEAGMAGTRLTLAGLVLTTGCAPVADAVVDVWQADADGVYDNAGYRLRGHVQTDATGRFVIETILPGEYPGRTEHIHVKVTPPGGATLTTQLYLPDNPANQQDSIFDPRLVVDLGTGGDPRTGRFTFILGG